MGAPSARVSELSQHWTQAGHDVTVLTGFPNHPTGKVPASYRQHFRRMVMKENVRGVKVIRTWLLPFPNRKSYERILNYASFSISAAITGLFASRPDVVIATSPQLLVGLAGWWLARIKRSKFVFEVRDLWPESLIAVGIGSKRSLLYRGLASIAKFLYRHSDRIVVVTPAFKDYLVNEFRLPSDKIFVVHNGVETDLFAPSASLNFKNELKLDGKFVVSYIGTMGMAHGLENVLEAAAIVQREHPEILFLLVGEGSDKKALIAKAKSANLSNVQFIDEQPREKIPDYIGASDICLVLLKSSEIFRTVIPTKMLEFMSCSRPIILGVDGQAKRVMTEARAGISIQPGSVHELTDAVIQLASDANLRLELGRNGRKYILQNFSRAETAAAYLHFLDSLTGVERVPSPRAA